MPNLKMQSKAAQFFNWFYKAFKLMPCKILSEIPLILRRIMSKDAFRNQSMQIAYTMNFFYSYLIFFST